MSKSRGHEHKQDRVFARRRSQLLKCFELAVERQYRLRYLAIGEVSEVVTRNSARCRSQRCDQRISICSLRDCPRHRHEKNVRWHEEHGTFDAIDYIQPMLISQ